MTSRTPFQTYLPFGRTLPLSTTAPAVQFRPEPPDLTSPSLSGKVLYPYQQEGAKWLRSRPKGLLADEMGLGKTAQVLRALPKHYPVVIVCPAFLRLVWRDELLDWRPDLTPYVCEPGTWQTPSESVVTITSFESLPDPPRGARGFLIGDPRLRNATLVVDEAHYVKSYKAQRTQKVQLLARQVARVWLLSGTPMLGKPKDLWGTLATGRLNFQAFDDWQTFCELFDAKKQFFGTDKTTGKTKSATVFPSDVRDGVHFDEVRTRLGRVALRRLRKTVLPELPGKTYQTIPVCPPEHLRGKLDQVGSVWVDRNELPPFEVMSEIRAELARSRSDVLREHVERFESEGTPLVVFSVHREPIESLGGTPGRGIITGDTPDELRRVLVDSFQTGLLGVLGCTLQAGGVGITLTRASHVLFVDQAWTPAENAQAEDRLVRIGQEASSVMVYRMIADHPVDRRVLEVLDAKQRLIEKTTGGAIG